jgi:hypothetical protein
MRTRFALASLALVWASCGGDRAPNATNVDPSIVYTGVVFDSVHGAGTLVIRLADASLATAFNTSEGPAESTGTQLALAHIYFNDFDEGMPGIWDSGRMGFTGGTFVSSGTLDGTNVRVSVTPRNQPISVSVEGRIDLSAGFAIVPTVNTGPTGFFCANTDVAVLMFNGALVGFDSGVALSGSLVAGDQFTGDGLTGSLDGGTDGLGASLTFQGTTFTVEPGMCPQGSDISVGSTGIAGSHNTGGTTGGGGAAAGGAGGVGGGGAAGNGAGGVGAAGNGVGGGGSGGAGGNGTGGVGGSAGASSGGSGGSAAGGTGGAGVGGTGGSAQCNALSLPSQAAEHGHTEALTTTATGGTLMPGAYALDDVEVYGVANTTPTDTIQWTITITAGTSSLGFDDVVHDTMSNAAIADEQASGTIAVDGTTLAFQSSCGGPSVGPAYGFTIDATNLGFTLFDTVHSVTFHFTRLPAT